MGRLERDLTLIGVAGVAASVLVGLLAGVLIDRLVVRGR
jgi:hypothetical protein